MNADFDWNEYYLDVDNGEPELDLDNLIEKRLDYESRVDADDESFEEDDWDEDEDFDDEDDEDDDSWDEDEWEGWELDEEDKI